MAAAACYIAAGAAAADNMGIESDHTAAVVVVEVVGEPFPVATEEEEEVSHQTFPSFHMDHELAALGTDRPTVKAEVEVVEDMESTAVLDYYKIEAHVRKVQRAAAAAER